MARMLNDWLSSYLEYTENLEAPDAFHFWSGVATIAAALQGKTWIDMGFFKWRPNFFIIFVAKPGTATKSTTIRVGQQLLKHIDGIHFGPKSLTWQYVTDVLDDSTEVYYNHDGEIITTSSITCIATELGTFLDPKNSYLIDMLVDLWDGQDTSWTRGTRGEGTSEIPNPWINFVGACTPSWISENFPEYAIGGGFVSRTIFVYADKKRKLVPYPKHDQQASDPDLEKKLIHDLREISAMVGEFELTSEAMEWGRAWYKELWNNRPPHLDTDRMSGYVARKQTHIHKLAMILSAARRNTQTIEVDDLQHANEFMGAIEQTMTNVFSQVSDNYQAKYASQVVNIISQSGRLSKAALWREVFHLMGWNDYEQAISACLNAGYIRAVQSQNTTYYEYAGSNSEQTGS